MFADLAHHSNILISTLPDLKLREENCVSYFSQFEVITRMAFIF